MNGRTIVADNILYEGTTYVPISALGKDVGWNKGTNTASVDDEVVVKERNKELGNQEVIIWMVFLA